MLVQPPSWPGRPTSAGKVRWESTEIVAGADARAAVAHWSQQYQSSAERDGGGSNALIVLNTAAQFMKNIKLLFKQMANLPIHNQAFNEIKQSSQGCRCVSQTILEDINLIALLFCEICSQMPFLPSILPSSFIFIFPAFLVFGSRNQMDGFLS